MRTIIVTFFALMAYVLAEAELPTPVPILSQNQDMGADGSFSSSFEAGNGISQSIEATIKKGPNDTEIQVVKGVISWVDADGTPRRLTFTADENGYQPEADFLPTAPPVPLVIQRALDFAAAHPQVSENESELA